MDRPTHALLVLACALVACDRGEPTSMVAAAPAVVATEAARDGEVSRDEIARLQALGYVDVDDDAETARDPRTGVVLHDASRSYPGYNLFTNAHLCSTQIVDAKGAVVRSWSLSPCFRWDNTSLFPNGDLLVIGRPVKKIKGGEGWGPGRYLARLGWNDEVVWKVPLSAHHDAYLTPRGQIAVLTAVRRNVPEIHPERDMKDDVLTLLTPDGEIVENASLYDLLKTAPPEMFRFEPRPNGQDHLDLLHANSVFWMGDPKLAQRDPLYALSNVVITFRHQNVITIIDWDAKKVVWAWGQGQLMGPHDAVVLPSGNILVLDNGLGRGWSRVVELDPIARSIVWQYRAPEPKSFFTLTRGASQRLPNGNTLVTQSGRGRAFEITPEGEIVWEFLNPNRTEDGRGAIVRMRRIEPAVVDAFLARDEKARAAAAQTAAAR
jgi:hypothetical protein